MTNNVTLDALAATVSTFYGLPVRTNVVEGRRELIIVSPNGRELLNIDVHGRQEEPRLGAVGMTPQALTDYYNLQFPKG